ncbi:hypothetical protein [Vitiosangium sp. GDMCC 1.1324]|uniref:hypothetical protein n=1 Tax=Vitiosangium sp. (strain GDMCC 1.1324) TaxID=2138576 RepID=UPI0011B38E3B|nr:hypothetical protein [Vitiosangium sp. GDMCC 1.1324]
MTNAKSNSIIKDSLRVFQKTVENPYSQDALEQFEKINKTKIPEELKSFFTEHSRVAVPDDTDSWESLCLFVEPLGLDQMFPGLLEWLDRSWGGRPEIESSFQPQEIEEINSKLRCFGFFKIDDESYDYFVFDQNGKTYVLHYHQDEWGKFEKLLKSKPAPQAIEELLKNFLDKVVQDPDAEIVDTDSSNEPTENPTPTPSHDDLLNQKISALASAGDAEGIFNLLVSWPHKTEAWYQCLNGRLLAPSSTNEQRKILKQLIKEFEKANSALKPFSRWSA